MHFKGIAVYTVALFALSACRSDKKSAVDVLAQDSSLTRDLQLAKRDTAAQPQLQDVPTTPPPATPRVATVEQAPAPATRRVARPASTLPRRTAEAPVRERTQQPSQTAQQQAGQVADQAAPPNPTPVRVRIPAVLTPSGNTVDSGPATVGQSEGRVGVVSAGTSLALNTGQRVCTNTNTVGDRITATLADAVTGSNGVVIPAGATAVLEVTSLKRSGQAGENMGLGLVVRSVMYEGKSYPVDGEITDAQTEKVRAQDGGDAGKVLGGAAVGAILGRIMGGQSKTKGTIIGAAGGAAAGAILANQTAKYDACIPSGGRVTVKLNSAMSVQAAP
ncbi:MAG: hypothetical protein ACR2MQ_16415 [Gemmatimonadaceae bacterium]